MGDIVGRSVRLYYFFLRCINPTLPSMLHNSPEAAAHRLTLKLRICVSFFISRPGSVVELL